MGTCYSFLPCSPQRPSCTPQTRRRASVVSRLLCWDTCTEETVTDRALSPREKCGCSKLRARELLHELESVLNNKELLEKNARALFESCSPPDLLDDDNDGCVLHTPHFPGVRAASSDTFPPPHSLCRTPCRAQSLRTPSSDTFLRAVNIPISCGSAARTASHDRHLQCEALRAEALRYIQQSHPCILASPRMVEQCLVDPDNATLVPPAAQSTVYDAYSVSLTCEVRSQISRRSDAQGDVAVSGMVARSRRVDSDVDTNCGSPSAASSCVAGSSARVASSQQTEHMRHVASVANNISSYLLKAQSRSSKPMSFSSFVRLYAVVLARTRFALGGDGFARQMFLSSTCRKTIWDAGYEKIKVLGEGSFGIVYLCREPVEPTVGLPNTSSLRLMRKMTLEDQVTCTTSGSTLWAPSTSRDSSQIDSFSSVTSIGSSKVTARRPLSVTFHAAGSRATDDGAQMVSRASLRKGKTEDLPSCFDADLVTSRDLSQDTIFDDTIGQLQVDGDAAAGLEAGGERTEYDAAGLPEVGREEGVAGQDDVLFFGQTGSCVSPSSRVVSFQRRPSETSHETIDSSQSADQFLEEITNQAGKHIAGRQVVVKEIKKHSAKNELPSDAIKEEISTLLRMDHPHVIRIFAAYEDTNYLYIVLDCARGGELQQIIENANRKKMSIAVPFVRKVMKQILSAVAYCHHMMVIHKDLKASNIMLLNDCDPTRQDCAQRDPHAVVIDFGFAEMFSPEGKNQRLAGTPQSMAPEIWRGFLKRQEAIIGPLVDIWGCGCILFQLFTGKDPFSVNNVNPRSWLKAISKGPQMQWLTHCSMPGKDLVKSMLQVDVDKRPTAVACLRHVWFTTSARATQPGTTPLSWLLRPSQEPKPATSRETIEGYSSGINSVVSRLFEYQKHNIAFKTFLMSIASQVSPNEVPEINALFRDFDVHRDGVLHHAEFVAAMQRAGVSTDVAEQCFACLDWSGDGVVQYTEFVAAMLKEENISAEARMWKTEE